MVQMVRRNYPPMGCTGRLLLRSGMVAQDALAADTYPVGGFEHGCSQVRVEWHAARGEDEGEVSEVAGQRAL